MSEMCPSTRAFIYVPRGLPFEFGIVVVELKLLDVFGVEQPHNGQGTGSAEAFVHLIQNVRSRGPCFFGPIIDLPLCH